MCEMGENSNTSSMIASITQKCYKKELQEISTLLWGCEIKREVFHRWSQGFEFSQDETSALLQKDGGPCCVIAPVQAYLLKILLMDTPGHSFNDLTADKCKRILIQAICNILMKCKMDLYRVATLIRQRSDSIFENHDAEMAEDALAVQEENLEAPDMEENVCADVNVNEIQVDLNHEYDCMHEPESFYKRLNVFELETIDEVEKFYSDNFHVLCDNYGVLLFLYTVMLTRGLENINIELSDSSEPLIHGTYGCGSQALINLMLTGRAVFNVWDNEQDVGGLKLKGIDQQSDIGFITLMEQMQYCTVGSFYKNPKTPIWIMGSETHLTVLFSTEKRLVSPETPSEIARRVFRQYDTEGSNFIPSAVLQDVLCALDLVSEPEYVDIMKKKLDPENLQIILLNDFMYEFFPEDKKSVPDTFDLMHYNGVANSNGDHKVKYHKGSAILLESDLNAMSTSSNPMLTCLQTKWPNIEVNWHDSRTPSLN